LLAELDPERAVIRIPVQEMRTVTNTTTRYFGSLRHFLGDYFSFVEEIANPFQGESTAALDLIDNAIERGLGRLDRGTRHKATRKRWLTFSRLLLEKGDTLTPLASLTALSPAMLLAMLEGKRYRNTSSFIDRNIGRLIDKFASASGRKVYFPDLYACRPYLATEDAAMLTNKVIAHNLTTYANRQSNR
jgi:hypothetical protein